MKIDLVFLIVLGFVVAYIFMLHKVETMADVGSLDQIKAAVKEIYLADVEAIRNLSNVATKLQAGGLTVPGKMTLSGPMVINNPDQQDKLIVYKNGDANPPYMYYNKQGTLGVWNGKASPWNIDENGTVNAGNVVLNTGIQNPNGQLRVSNQGIMFGGPNTDREINSGQISAGLHIPDSLNIVGMSNKDKGSRRVDMWAEGGLNVYGSLTVNGNVFQKKNRARFIRVGNTEASLRKDFWTLIELKAYDHDGNNVARGKPVKILQGTPYDGSAPGKITDGVVFNAPTALYDNPNEGYHGSAGINVVEIDLGSEINLSQIELFNRWNGAIAYRMDGTTVEFIGADGQRNRIINTGTWHTEYSKEYLL